MAIGPATAAALAAGGCLLVGVANPSTSGLIPPCPFKVLTGGLDCPGCGASRAVYHLLRGRVATAAGFNVLLLVALPVVAYAWLAWAFPGRVPAVRLRPWMPWAIAAVVAAFWVLRNIPVAPLTALHT